jgi:hypothetical protein
VKKLSLFLGLLGIFSSSQLAHATGEAASDAVATPDAAAAPAALATEPAPLPDSSSEPRLPAARAPHVIWAAPGTAPIRRSWDPPTVASPARSKGIRGVRILVGLERASSIAGYSSSSSPEEGADVVTHGVEASVIGEAAQEPFTPLVLPRLGFDARVTEVVSAGLSFSYAAHSAEQSSGGTKQILPSSESLLLGPRLGWWRPLSDHIALWLRGGPTWAQRASSEPTSQPGQRLIFTQRQWAVSLEPQLLIMPIPHVAVSFGAAFDIGVTGQNQSTYRGGPARPQVSLPTTTSTYGLTAGLLALF